MGATSAPTNAQKLENQASKDVDFMNDINKPKSKTTTNDDKKKDIPINSDNKTILTSFRMDKDIRDKLIGHFKNKGMDLSTGIRNILYEYAKNKIN